MYREPDTNAKIGIVRHAGASVSEAAASTNSKFGVIGVGPLNSSASEYH